MAYLLHYIYSQGVGLVLVSFPIKILHLKKLWVYKIQHIVTD